jgi:DNA-binding response OmpR family regulator
MTGTQRAILLVEEDAALAQKLRQRLTDRGYIVSLAASAAEAEARVDTVTPDLVVIDLTLPDQHGLVLCANLSERLRVPIIICISTQRKDDAVLAFRLGAADVVAKPLSIDELEARIARALRAPTRRLVTRPDGRLNVGPLLIDLSLCTVTVGSHEIQTTPTEFRLLCALAQRPNQVLSLKVLAEAAWGSHQPLLEASLKVHLRRLRAKLKSAPTPSPAVVTVRGFGFRLVWDTPLPSPHLVDCSMGLDCSAAYGHQS